MQRIRIVFSRGQQIKYISHLDLLRMWERIFRRAGVPLAYTRGFNPHPRLSLAAPLPVGVLAFAEMLEAYVEPPVSIAELRRSVEPQAPAGVCISHVEEVAGPAPALPAMVRAAEYQATIDTLLPRGEIQGRIDALLRAQELPRVRRRPKKGQAESAGAVEARQYDLRPLIEDVRIERWNAEKVVGMRLRAAPGGTGRPEEVLDGLRVLDSVVDVTRVQLIVGE